MSESESSKNGFLETLYSSMYTYAMDLEKFKYFLLKNLTEIGLLPIRENEKTYFLRTRAVQH